jgi:hypothetical protein
MVNRQHYSTKHKKYVLHEHMVLPETGFMFVTP